MGDKGWRQIERLFHAASGLAAEERAAYLACACPEDAALRREVESLITAGEDHPGFMEQPALSLWMKVLSEDSAGGLLVGRRIGPYQILSLLGRGGMGEVYLAEDTRLDRKVALKFLSGKFVHDAWAKRQLVKEAQAAAKLDHPNICAVFGLEEHDGHSFIVMRYVEGETLAALIRRGIPEPRQVLDLVVQAVSALSTAHSHGIIHRDIKPQNIMVTAGGQVKVLDFGLAKVVRQVEGALSAKESESQESQSGLVIGTVAYMSPEQLRAEKLDFRSDLFSFGTVLYEMVSGRNPHARGSHAETISAILTSEAPPLVTPTTPTHRDLARIAQRCLKRDREQRYQSASELLLDLGYLQKGVPIRSGRPTYLSLHARLALALLFLLIVMAALTYPRLTRVQTLAVLPIVGEGEGADAGDLSGGLTEALGDRLSRLSKLRIKSPTVVSDQGRQIDPQEVGRSLGADSVLVGAITLQGGRLTLQTRLIRTADGSPLWTQEYPVRPAELLALQEELCVNIAAALRLPLSPEEKRLLVARPTTNPEAHRWYVRGRYYWGKRDKENIKRAIDCFQKAIDLDPAYARAHAGLADCYVVMGSVAYGPLPAFEARSKAKASARAALEIDDTLCEAHTSLGVVMLKYEWNWSEAEARFKRAISLNPDYAPAHFWYSNLLALTKRWGESIAESETAKQLDPYSPLSEMNLGRTLYHAGQYDRAARLFADMLEKDPQDPKALYMLAFSYLQQERLKEAIELLEKLQAVDKLVAAAPLGYAYAKAGRRAEAVKILDEINQLSKQVYVPHQEKAIICVGLGDKDQAFALLQKACQERFSSFPGLLAEPLLDGLRSDPRFAGLTRCANLAM